MSCMYLINKRFFTEDKISNEALVVLIGIRTKFSSLEKVCLTYSMLEYMIFGDEDEYQKQRPYIISGFNELVDKQIIKVTRIMKGETFICDISKLFEYDETCHYVGISKDEFQKIINLDDGVHNYKLLRYFIDLVGTFNASKTLDAKYRFHIGDLSQSTLCNVCGINIATLNKYNEVLERNKLIYIAKRKSVVVNGADSGRIFKRETNIYSRYCEKDICEDYVRGLGFNKVNDRFVNNVNEMRSLSQKYNYFKRTYADKMCEDLDKVQAAYAAAKLWNRYVKEDYNTKVEAGESPVEPKYKDLSIFEKYGLTD